MRMPMKIVLHVNSDFDCRYLLPQEFIDYFDIKYQPVTFLRGLTVSLLVFEPKNLKDLEDFLAFVRKHQIALLDGTQILGSHYEADLVEQSLYLCKYMTRK